MSKKIHRFGVDPDGQTIYVFHCPGCGYGHPYHVPRWNWNGSMDKPTFTPSLLVNGHMPEHRCHCFVTDGRIQFCGDSHHALAGQTVDLPDWDEEPEPSVSKAACPESGSEKAKV